MRVEVFKRIGSYPTETSEHSSEYLSWFLRSPEQVDRFRLRPLEYVGISEDNVAEFEVPSANLAAGRPVQLEEGASEYAPQVIHRVEPAPSARSTRTCRTGASSTTCGRVRRRGPDHGRSRRYRSGPDGSAPRAGRGAEPPYVSVNELTVHAARTGDPVAIRQAVLMDPNASSTLTPEQIWELCNDLVVAHGDLLPETAARDDPRTRDLSSPADAPLTTKESQ